MGVGKGPQDGALTGRRRVVESDLKLCKTPADICISYCAQCQRKNDHYHHYYCYYYYCFNQFGNSIADILPSFAPSKDETE